MFLSLCRELLEMHFFEICLLILAYFILFLFFFFLFSFYSASLDAFPKEDKVVRINAFYHLLL